HWVSSSDQTTPEIFLTNQTAGPLTTFPNNLPVEFRHGPQSVRFVKFGRRRRVPTSDFFVLNRNQGLVLAHRSDPDQPRFKLAVGTFATAGGVESTVPIQLTRTP